MGWETGSGSGSGVGVAPGGLGEGVGVGVGVDIGVGLSCNFLTSGFRIGSPDECNDIPSKPNIIAAPKPALKSLFIPIAFLLSSVPVGYTSLCVYNSQHKPHR